MDDIFLQKRSVFYFIYYYTISLSAVSISVFPHYNTFLEINFVQLMFSEY